MKYIFTILILTFFVGCHYKLDFRHDLFVSEDASLDIEGKIIENKLSNKPYYVVLYKIEKKEKLLVDFSTHYVDKNFSFHVIPGKYIIHGIQEPEIRSDIKKAYIFTSDEILVTKESKSLEIDMNVPLEETPNINKLIGSINQKSIFDSISHGQKIKLDNSIFDDSNIQMGLWHPSDFLLKIGGGIYFYNDFDSSKIPILFVHGISGSPRNFSSIIENIDKEKYQILFYYYPSGTNLNSTIELLKFQFDQLIYKYKYDKVVVIAHSMGGLVARGFINNYFEKIDIPIFITLSTPWNGQKFAELGGINVGKIVPSFGNMYPQSAFQKKLYLTNPYTKIKHYLLFGYKGKKSLVLDNSNDGVISLSSFLYPPVQKKASKVIGLNVNHREILHDKGTIEEINNILSE